MRKILLFPALLLSIFVIAQNEKVDLNMVKMIREEGLNHSQVMEIAFNLTDASGPRLMQSPGYFRAANWAKTKLTEWGLQNARLEPWGDWGRGWELQKSYIALTAPYYKPVIAFPKTWTKSTAGLQTAEVMIVEAQDSAAMEALGDKLKGKIIITPRTDTLRPTFMADAVRLTDEDLQKMSDFDPAKPITPRGQGTKPQFQLSNTLKEIAEKYGAVAVLTTSTRNGEGTVFVQQTGTFKAGAPQHYLKWQWPMKII